MNKIARNVSPPGKAGKFEIMPEPSPTESEKASGTADRMVLFCEECYRYDKHIPVKTWFVFKAVIVILTLGLALIFWPKRCSCCGSIRF